MGRVELIICFLRINFDSSLGRWRICIVHNPAITRFIFAFLRNSRNHTLRLSTKSTKKTPVGVIIAISTIDCVFRILHKRFDQRGFSSISWLVFVVDELRTFAYTINARVQVFFSIHTIWMQLFDVKSITYKWVDKGVQMQLVIKHIN